ncbi:hypothetical protein VTG60DRAFT_1965 [Thermothelomyces hinnuleus]
MKSKAIMRSGAMNFPASTRHSPRFFQTTISEPPRCAGFARFRQATPVLTHLTYASISPTGSASSLTVMRTQDGPFPALVPRSKESHYGVWNLQPLGPAVRAQD